MAYEEGLDSFSKYFNVVIDCTICYLEKWSG